MNEPGAEAANRRLTNWAGNFSYGTDSLHEAASIEQIRSILRSQNRVKALGTRHSFNSIADSSHAFLSLRSMRNVVALNADRRTVTVEAGTTYAELCPHLDSKGFALSNLASLPHISIAGACSTATHGSGEDIGNLATQVSAVEFLTADGELLQLSREADGDVFAGTVVGLGALGVITTLTLDVQPKFAMRQRVYEDMPLSQAMEHFDAIQSSAYSVSLFTDWQRERIKKVWLKSRIGGEPSRAGDSEFFGAKPAAHNLHPLDGLSAENCTGQLGVPGPWFDRLPHFRAGFVPSAGNELQSEYFVPRRNARDAILAVERLRDVIAPHLLISEIRTVAADDFWMSTCYRRPSVGIHFTWKPDWPSVKGVLPVIERELGPFSPRPHWGKLFTMPPSRLRTSYERVDDFSRLARKYDPQGKLRNDFLRTYIFTDVAP